MPFLWSYALAYQLKHGGVDDNSGIPDNCGTGCTWTYNSTTKTLTITGSGNTIPDVNTWKSTDIKKAENLVITGVSELNKNSAGAFADFKSLKNISADNNLRVIGEDAFKNCKAIQSFDIPSSVTTIGTNAFRSAFATSYTDENGNTVGTSLVIPDSVTTIGKQAFDSNKLSTIIIPDNVTLDPKALNGSTADIICQGNVATCEQKATAANAPAGSTKAASELQCFGDKHYWNGTNCVNEPEKANRTCSSSYKMNDGLCDRVRYTPAEAAKVVTNDNNNSVTITFKK